MGIKRFFVSTIYVVACSALVGCGGISLNHDYGDYAEVYDRSSDKQLLLNLARLSQDEAPYFIQLGQISAQHTLSGTASVAPSAASVGKGPGLLGIMSSLGTTVSEQPTFQFVPLSGPAFSQAVIASISPRIFYTMYDQGVPADDLARLMIESVRFSATDAPGEPETIYRNDPQDSSYPEFLAWCYQLRSIQMLKLLTVQAVMPTSPDPVQVKNPSISDIKGAEEDGFTVIPFVPKNESSDDAKKGAGSASAAWTVTGPVAVTVTGPVTVTKDGAGAGGGGAAGNSGNQTASSQGGDIYAQAYWANSTFQQNLYHGIPKLHEIGRKYFDPVLPQSSLYNLATDKTSTSAQQIQMRTFLSAMQGAAKEEQYFKSGFKSFPIVPNGQLPSDTDSTIRIWHRDGTRITFYMGSYFHDDNNNEAWTPLTLTVLPILEMKRHSPIPENQHYRESVSLNYEGEDYSIGDRVDESGTLANNGDLTPSNRKVFSLLSYLYDNISLDPKTLPAAQYIQVQ